MDKQVLEFLSQLKENNNREWFAENKPRYEKARIQVLDFVGHLIPEMVMIDDAYAGLNASDCVFRIYRDVRFSKDKSPYKTNFGAYLVPGGKKSNRAGVYLQIAPGDSFLAGGSYAPPADILKKIRSEVYYNIDEFKKIISAKDFLKNFGELRGSKLVRPPVGFPTNFADIELLKFKDYIVFSKIDDDMITSPKLTKHILNLTKIMKPFDDFLNRAIVE